MAIQGERQLIDQAADAFVYVRGISGALCVVAPGAMSRGWTAEASHLPGGQLAMRSLGSREVALAWGLSQAGGDPARRRPWLLASAVADAVDVAGTLWSRRKLRGGWGSAATIVLGSIACAVQLAASARRSAVEAGA
jgi:hypothetical protein